MLLFLIILIESNHSKVLHCYSEIIWYYDINCYCHILTLVPLFYLCFSMVKAWFGVGSLCLFFYVVLCVWPGMVLNQRQVSLPSVSWMIIFCFVFVFHRSGLFSLRSRDLLFLFEYKKEYEYLPRCTLVLLFISQRRALQLHWTFNARSLLVSGTKSSHFHERMCQLERSEVSIENKWSQ
jgi:hypothetical protein